MTAPPRFYNTSTLLSYKTTHFFFYTHEEMSRRFFLALTVIAAIATMTAAQKTIADHLQQSTGGRVTIHQPAMLNMRLSPENGDTTNLATHELMRNEKNTVGYRIQVFSDRNQRTAKGEALSKERNIKASFPDMGTYISYDAPSWRLRVGDFRTREEAKVQLDELRELFPGYANEMIIVVDVINTAQ